MALYDGEQNARARRMRSAGLVLQDYLQDADQPQSPHPHYRDIPPELQPFLDLANKGDSALSEEHVDII